MPETEAKEKTSFTISRATIEALDEMKAGLSEAHNLAGRQHSRGLALELAVHHTLAELRGKVLSYEDFYDTPFAAPPFVEPAGSEKRAC